MANGADGVAGPVAHELATEILRLLKLLCEHTGLKLDEDGEARGLEEERRSGLVKQIQGEIEAQIEQLRTQERAEHIILLEHRFGQRRSGNQAARSRLRRQDALLNYLATHYPDVTIYPLVWDTFSRACFQSCRHGFRITAFDWRVGIAYSRLDACSTDDFDRSFRLRRGSWLRMCACT